jgi:hydroxyacylglutathione hydrolase
MLLRRLYHDRLAQAAYLIACQSAKEAIVVDPLGDPARYLDAARRDGVRITHVTETHVHADFLSGAATLATEAGAMLLLSREGSGAGGGYQRDAFPGAHWIGEGHSIRIGSVELSVMHVPGHTPEHLAFLVTDHATSHLPMGMVSGDFLFVGDVGRPDLLERAVGMQGTMQASARELFASLARAATLPDYLQIWPGHGAGSACGKSLGAVPQSTIGYERRSNWALAIHDESEFVAEVLRGQPEPPAYFARMKRINASGGARRRDDAQPREEAALVDALAAGAVAVDLRPAADFAAGHPRGALSVPLGGSFLTWAGSVVSPDRDLVLIMPHDRRAEAEAAASDLALIGFDRVLGILSAERLAARGVTLETMPSVAASVIGAVASPGATVLDVRSRTEWAAGHVPGARHIPLAELSSRVGELADAGPVLVHCQGGSRSAVAASLLRAAGIDDVANVAGGYTAWARAGHSPATGE